MSLLIWKPTACSGVWGEFRDADGHTCEMAAGLDRAAPLLFLGPPARLVRLAPTQVAELLPHLKRFAETGRLTEEGAGNVQAT